MSMPRKRNGQVARAVRLALMASSLPLMVSQTVLAQEGEDEEMVQIEEITVTGSRIASANLVSASPVTTITSSEMQMTGITRVEDMLNRLPQIAPAQTSGLANGSTGTATVDLGALAQTARSCWSTGVDCRPVRRTRPRCRRISTRFRPHWSSASKY